MVDKALLLLRIEERGEELKVPHHASTAMARDGNLPYIIAVCFYSQQLYSLNYIIIKIALSYSSNRILKFTIILHLLILTYINSISKLIILFYIVLVLPK